MFPDFLPRNVNLLTEPSAIALAKQLQRQPIPTPYQPVDTAYIREENNAPPILLLHGFDSSVLEFRRLVPLLSSQHETWAIDLLGFGFTERYSNITYNPGSIRTHLYCFWKSLINQPLVLVGASMGGAAAIDFTLAYPQAVRKLVLINSVGYTGSYPIGQWLVPPFDTVAVEFWRQRRLQSLFWGNLIGMEENLINAIRCAALPSEMPLWEQSMTRFLNSGGYYQLADKITRVKKPTLILWGRRDDVLGTADADKFRKAIAHSRLVWLNTGHTPHWEAPQAVADEILGFCQK
ncbi:MAG: alpha/beta fold hydrolase [Cyanophyceae cyanobacterium]